MELQLERIVSLICEIGQLPSIDEDEDIYEAGFSSTAALQLLMELESLCDVPIPDDEFIVARTVNDLYRMLIRLQGERCL